MNVTEYETYLAGLVDRGNLSADTKRSYVGSIERFAEWRSVGGEPDISEFKSYCMERATEDGLSGASLNVAKSAFRKYLVMVDRADEYSNLQAWFNEHFTVSSGTNTDRLDAEELAAFRDAAEADPRQHAIVELFVATGLRVGELVRLDRDDISFNPESIPDIDGAPAGAVRIYRQKRQEGVEDWRPLNDRAAGAVDAYIDALSEYAPPEAVATPGLFVNGHAAWVSSTRVPAGVEADTTKDGKPATYRITPWTVNDELKSVATRCSHPDVTAERMHAHLLRHTVGSQLGDEGYTAEQVGQFLGRASPAESYVHTDSKAISEMASALGDEGN